MNTTSPSAPSTATRKLHPLQVAAALSVIGASALGAVAWVGGHVSARAVAAPEQQTVSTAAAPAAVEIPAPQPAAAAPAPRPASPARISKPARPAPRPAPIEAAPAAQPLPAPVAAAAAPLPVCTDCGTVVAIREVRTPGNANGVGAVAGGVIGGVIGNQIGKGNGRDAARILGAIGGAVAGHQIEKQARTTVRYEVDVRMDDGALRTLARDAAPDLRAGDAVRLQGEALLTHDGRPVGTRPQPAPVDRGGA